MMDETLVNANILIIDDQEENINALVGLLGQKGFTNVKTTTDSRLTVRLYEEFKPDLLLLDLKMPHVTGLQVMEQLKVLIPPNTYFPILMLNADTTPESKKISLAGGASDFLSPPFDLAEVDLRVKYLLRIRYFQQQLEYQNLILDKEKEAAENIFNTVREPLLALDKDLRVVQASRSFYNFFKVSSEDTIGSLIYDLGNGQWNIPKLRELLETILPEKTTFDNYEVEHHFAAIGKRIMLLNARQIEGAFGKEKRILLAIEDITERKIAGVSLINSENRYRRLFDSAKDGILILDAETGKIVDVNPYLIDLLGYSRESFIENEIWEIGFFKDIAANYYKFIELQQKEYVRYDNLPLETGNGRKINVEFVSNVYLVDNKKVIQCNIRNITERKRAEEELRKSEQRFFALFERSAFVMVLSRLPNGVILNVNAAFEQVFGFTKEEAIGRTTLELGINPNAADRQRVLAQLQAQGSVRDIEIELHTRAGETRAVFVNVDLIDIGDEKYILNTMQDITGRRRAEEKIAYQAHLLVNMNDAVLASDEKFVLTAWNLAAEQIYGWKAEEVIGKSGTEILQSEFLTISRPEAIKQLIDEGKYFAEIIQSRKDGTKIYIETQTTALRDPNGKTIGYVSINRDITERKLAEEELKRKNTFIQIVLDNLPIGIALNEIDKGSTFYLNKKFAEIYGWPKQELDDIMGFFKKVYPDDKYREELMTRIMADIQSGDVSRMHWEDSKITHKDGSHHIVNAVNIPLIEQNTMVSTVIDVTEVKNALQALSESEEKYRNLIENINDVFYSVNAEGIITFVNSVAESVLEYKPDELIGKHFVELVYSEDLNRILEQFGKLKKGSVEPGEYRMIKKSGKICNVRTSSKGLYDGSKFLGLTGVLNDITSRIEIENALKESEEKFRKIFEDGPMGIVMATMPDGRILNANGYICEMLGYTEEEMKLLTFIDITHPDHRLVDIEDVEKLSEGIIKKHYTEKRYLKKNGDVFWAFRALTIIKSKDGKSSYALAILNNITDRKLAEEELINSKIQLGLLYRHLNDVRENERSTISREIHDELGQSLTALKIDLNWTKDKVGSNLDLMKKLNGMIKIVNETIQKVQKISSDLRPAMLDDLGLIPAIEWYCQNFEERTGLKCYLELKEIQAVSPEINVTLFRILQEGMTNITRHADAKCVEVKLYSDSNFICLKIKDDGIGFNKQKLNPNNSLGLIGIKERVKLCNGNVEIISSENNGAELVISIPIIN